jgi:hypothetical protein
MSNADDDDMDQPLTKREFRAAVDTELLTKREFRAAVDTELLTKREALELFPTKQEVRDMFANFLDAILSRIDERFTQQDKRFEERFSQQDERIQRLFKNAEGRLTRELREQLGAIDRDHFDDINKLEDKYRDLPNRVSKLEAAVFPAPPAKRQRRR